MDTFLCCMRQSFEYFGGMTKILFDNMKTVVQKRLLKEIVLTSVFADFAHYYGFQVDLRTGKRRTKGESREFREVCEAKLYAAQA